MTTASEIIEQAFREANITPIGRAPTSAEQNEALPRLNNFIARLFGTKLGEFAMDWPVPPNRAAPVAARYPLRPQDTKLPSDVWPYPPNNVRLLLGNDTDTTVYLPYRPNPGARLAIADAGATASVTIDPNGRRIEGAPTISVGAADAPREWFYREDLGSWQRVSTLALDDDSPLPAEFDDLLVTALAKRLAPRFGQEILPTTQEVYMDAMRRLEQKYQQYMPVGGGFDPVLMSKQAHDGAWWSGEDNLYG